MKFSARGFARLAKAGKAQLGVGFFLGVFMVGMIETFGVFGTVPIVMRLAWRTRKQALLAVKQALRSKAHDRGKKAQGHLS